MSALQVKDFLICFCHWSTSPRGKALTRKNISKADVALRSKRLDAYGLIQAAQHTLNKTRWGGLPKIWKKFLVQIY